LGESRDKKKTYICSQYSSGVKIDCLEDWGPGLIKHHNDTNHSIEKIANIINASSEPYNPIFRNCMDFVRPLDPTVRFSEFFIFFVFLVSFAVGILLIISLVEKKTETLYYI